MNQLPYRPHPLIRSGHLQTLMVGVRCGWRPPYRAKEIVVPLHDGESLVVHEELGDATPSNAPLSILIHGLGGDHRSPYLQRIAHRLAIAGHRVWRVDLRGCGAGLNHAWRPPHAGRSLDLAAVIVRAAREYPQAAINVAGFSLSGNIVLKMLGEAGANQLQLDLPLDRIQLALAIAAPVDLSVCADNMDRVSRRIYTKYYLRVLADQVNQRRSIWPQWKQIPATPTVRTIRQFDSRYTAPLSGFQDTDHYYSESSSISKLTSIVTPTLILIDRHDPIVTSRIFRTISLNADSTNLVFTERGGHMGYFGLDASGKVIRWMEYFVQNQLLRGTNDTGPC
ncbi:MAG: alpha/beta fold hydrolase [Planctomycetales bacterium]|nr:alpha/beta fold hydrolase [Planctomycetales bacterium]